MAQLQENFSFADGIDPPKPSRLLLLPPANALFLTASNPGRALREGNQMMYRARIAGAFAILGTITVGGAALASPGSGVTPQTFVTAPLSQEGQVNHESVKFQTRAPTLVRMQRLTFAPGSRTGWHHHPGVVIVAVESGSVTLTDTNCGSRTYGPGSPNGSVFVEGHDDAHEASSVNGAVVYVTYVSPTDTFRLENAATTCGQ